MNLLKSYNIFLHIHCNFCKEVSNNLFGNLSDHIYTKWEGNVILFLNRLDDFNKIKLLKWAEEECRLL